VDRCHPGAAIAKGHALRNGLADAIMVTVLNLKLDDADSPTSPAEDCSRAFELEDL